MFLHASQPPAPALTCFHLGSRGNVEQLHSVSAELRGKLASLPDGSHTDMVWGEAPCPLNGLLGYRTVPSFTFHLPVCLNDPVSSDLGILPYFNLAPVCTQCLLQA